jgi:hypothetical protein
VCTRSPPPGGNRDAGGSSSDGQATAPMHPTAQSGEAAAVPADARCAQSMRLDDMFDDL